MTPDCLPEGYVALDAGASSVTLSRPRRTAATGGLTRRIRARVSVRTVVFALALMTVFTLGIVERWMLFVRGPESSDEAIVVLMGRSLLHGHFPAMYWGQNYGGTPEILPVGIITQIIGVSVVAQRMSCLLLGAASCWLAWLIANRLMGRAGAWMSASILWVWPFYFVGWSMRELDFYIPTVALGLFALWAALRSWSYPGSRWIPAAVGISAGLGWWMGPSISVFAVPVIVALLRVRERRWYRIFWSTTGFFVGALPWIAYTYQHHYATLRATTGATTGSYLARLDALLYDGGPLMFGLKYETGAWIGGHWTHVLWAVLLLLVAVACAMCLIAGALRKIVPPVDMIGLLCYPWIYALTNRVGSIPGHFAPRYFFWGWPFVAFAAGRLLTVPDLLRRLGATHGDLMQKRIEPLKGVAVIVAILLGWFAIVQVGHSPAIRTPNYQALARSLQKHRIRYAYAGYWEAYLIDVAAEGHVMVSAADVVRNRQWGAQVARSPDPAWIFSDGAPQIPPFEKWRRDHSVGDTEFSVAGFLIVVPAHKILPSELPADAYVTV